MKAYSQYLRDKVIEQGSLKVTTNDRKVCLKKCINVIARSHKAVACNPKVAAAKK